MKIQTIDTNRKTRKPQVLTNICLLALLLAACAPKPIPVLPTRTPVPEVASISDAPTTTLPNGLVDIGGRKLMFRCTGQGSPTVILEAGSGESSSTWLKVQSGIDNNYRVCSYDRANLGESDAAVKPRTLLDMVRDLHALLATAQISGPYILVGHSMGGMLVRVFADLYPEEVVGLVLVDSAHPDMGSRLMAGLPPESLSESEAIKATRQYFNAISNSDGQLPNDPEGVDIKTSNKQVKAAKPLGDLLLVVISRSPDNPAFGYIPSSLPADINARLRQIWQDMQSELAGLSSSSTRVIAAHAGHYIQEEEPELVIDAIRKLVDEARDQLGLTNSPGQPADQADAAHTPRILGVADRQQEMRDDQLILHKDIIFADDAGDVVYDQARLVSADPPGDYPVSGGFITASSEEQKDEAMDPLVVVCPSIQTTFVIEVQIVDQAYNRSEPVLVTFNCPASKVHISPSLIIGLVIGLALLGLAIWLLVRYRIFDSHHIIGTYWNSEQ